MATRETTKDVIVEVDLAIVVRRSCGCFAKYYFDLDGTMPADSDIECCKGHSTEFETTASKEARKEADRIRARVRNGEPLVKALEALLRKIDAISNDDDGCLYINGRTAGEFTEPIAQARAALTAAGRKP